jgi:hypothetical protein
MALCIVVVGIHLRFGEERDGNKRGSTGPMIPIPITKSVELMVDHPFAFIIFGVDEEF